MDYYYADIRYTLYKSNIRILSRLGSVNFQVFEPSYYQYSKSNIVG